MWLLCSLGSAHRSLISLCWLGLGAITCCELQCVHYEFSSVLTRVYHENSNVILSLETLLGYNSGVIPVSVAQ